MIAFEFPKTAVNPDLVTDADQSVWIKGCKNCQNFLSKCSCGNRVESRLKLYNHAHEFGGETLTRNFFHFFRLEDKAWVPKDQVPSRTLATNSKFEKILHRRGIQSGVAINSFDEAILDFELRLLPFEDSKVVSTNVSDIVAQTVDPKQSQPRNYHEFAGTSNVLGMCTERVYITYPIEKFKEVAEVFHRYSIELTIRPKELPGPDTKAAKGLGPDQGGVAGKIFVRWPSNALIAGHIAKVLDIEPPNWKQPELFEFNHTKAAANLILLHGFKQSTPFGPEWKSPEQKSLMYSAHGLSHLLRNQA